MPTCPTCLDTYPARGGGHCGSCHRTFTSDSSAAAHRVGRYQPDERRCLDVSDTPGWRRTDRGWTNEPQMPRAVLAARRSGTNGGTPVSDYPQPS